MQLNVSFSEIPECGIECEIKDSSWFPEDHVEQAGPATVRIRLTKKNDNRIELQGKLRASVTLECDRCLNRYVFEVDSSMQLIVEVAEKGEHWRLQGIEPADVELETISQDKPVVDLAELLQQQLFLALPEKRLCMNKCRGLCQKCGANLNEGTCACASGTSISPFAVLEGLKKK